MDAGCGAYNGLSDHFYESHNVVAGFAVKHLDTHIVEIGVQGWKQTFAKKSEKCVEPSHVVKHQTIEAVSRSSFPRFLTVANNYTP